MEPPKWQPLVGDAMGVAGESAIEDLFPETFYADAVLSLYRRHLPEDANGPLTLTPGGTLAKRVERALAQHNISFNKGSVAKLLCEKIRAMKSIAELPPETATRAEKLLASLAASLAKAPPPVIATARVDLEAKPLGGGSPVVVGATPASPRPTGANV
jgi:hypothetical protein